MTVCLPWTVQAGKCTHSSWDHQGSVSEWSLHYPWLCSHSLVNLEHCCHFFHSEPPYFKWPIMHTQWEGGQELLQGTFLIVPVPGDTFRRLLMLFSLFWLRMSIPMKGTPRLHGAHQSWFSPHKEDDTFLSNGQEPVFQTVGITSSKLH